MKILNRRKMYHSRCRSRENSIYIGRNKNLIFARILYKIDIRHARGPITISNRIEKSDSHDLQDLYHAST